MERAVLVTGYYGFGNTGDEAILSALVAGLASRSPGVRIRVLSGDPVSTRAQHGVEAVPWRDPLSIAEEVRRSDLVVVGGGGLFQDYAGIDPATLLTPRHGGITFYAGPAVLAALAHKPFALYGVGVGPLASLEAREIVHALAKAAAFLSVRDAGSRDLLAASGIPAERIRLAADPAFLLGAERVRPEDVLLGVGIEPRAPIAGVALRPWSYGADPAVWEREVAAALALFLERTAGTLLFVPFERSPWSADDDFAVASRVLRRLDRPARAAALSGVLSPAETAGLLSGCDLVLAMRFHAGVFAISGGAPAVGIAYDPKVEALFATAGLADFLEPLNGISGTSLFTRMERALSGGEPLRAALTSAAARARRLAAADLDALAALAESPPLLASVAPEMLALIDEALSANLLRMHELSAQVEIQRADKTALALRYGDLEARLASAEAVQTALRASETDLARRLEAAAETHRREVTLLERQGVEARGELHRVQTSRFWKTVNLYWRSRRAAARLTRPLRERVRDLRGAAPTDWVGSDPSAREAASAPSPQIENRFDVVCFSAAAEIPPQVRRLTESGHRVVVVAPKANGEGAARGVEETARNLFAVSLPAPDKDAADADNALDSFFEALDALRRDQGLGATLSLVLDPYFLPVAERMRAERAWPLLTEPAEKDALVRVFPKLSVVVVTWNGKDLNRLCLESLIARTEWPNLEIFVVDNGSTDGTPELLAELSRREPRITVIANAENRGFAAAANQGLAAAEGEYLAILNNDTVVTRGWAAALVRHLSADPKLGLVGPVTNAIANAAKVDAGYASVGDLPAWAAGWVRAHDGETFDIRMLALFCAALPRRVFEEVGPLDERFGIGMFEDNDYSRRVRAAGYAVRCARDAFVHHWQMASFRKMPKEEYFALFAENRRKFEEKWGEPGEVAPAAPATAARFATREEHRAQLSAVLERVAASKGAIVFLPSVGWGIHLFQRPHHLARVFARLGYVAIFDSSNANDRVDGFREIEPNLFLFSGAEELLHEVPSPVLWAFPYNFHHADGYPPGSATVYDWIDDLDVFPQDRALLEKNHARGLKEATVVASVARRLHEQALATRPDALYLPNGVEYERFAAPAPPPRDDELLRFLPRGAPVAGYYGALAEWFDYPLLDAVAASRPDWRFVLIGPQYDKSLPGQPLLARENVRWLGPRDYVTLPGYLSLFDVATIPFRINPITLATSPLKLFEYFAGGKPVVTTPMPECQAHPEVRIAATPEEFARALDAALPDGRDPAFRARLRSVARANSWETRVRTALAALARVSGHPRPGPQPARASLSGMSSLEGRCNICGRETRFRYTDPSLFRESLVCEGCLSTSRYRSIARGLLEAFRNLAGVESRSLAELPREGNGQRLRVYDTQVPFSTGASAYPIPGFLEKCPWIDLAISTWRPDASRGEALGPGVTNQNLECLAFPDAVFDVVVTSDVLEHVRLEEAAHREIRRVLKPGGVYIFTVPHFRDRSTVRRVEVVDPADPSRDVDLLEREYHGDANSPEGRSLAYRSFGTDLDEELSRLGFEVEYTKRDFPEAGIFNTELFFCRVTAPPTD